MVATRFVTTADGVELAYWTLGSGGVPLIVMPLPILSTGAGELAIEGSRSFYERLARHRMVVRFDHRGTGESERRVAAFTPEVLDADLEAIVATVGADQVDLWAQEDAGLIAVRYAARHPERVRHLVLWGTWARPEEIGEPAAVQQLENLMEHNFAMWLESAVAVIWRWPGAEGRTYADLLKQSVDAENVRAFLRAAWHWDVSDMCALVAARTLVVNRRDQPVFIPAAGAKLAARIPGSTRVVLEGDSQYPWVGDAEAVLRLFEDFVGSSYDESTTELATVLFTDIVSSTERTAAVGDRGWSAILDRFEEGVRREITRFQGREVFTKGDEFLITFDNPGRAVQCAIAIRSVARTQGLVVRTGLHAGQVERRGTDVTGIAVNIGARVSSAAAPDEILVSRTVVDLLAGSGLAFADRGQQPLKGVPDAWHLYSVES